MAWRFDASTDRLLRTAGLPDYNAPYTLLGWYYYLALPVGSGARADLYSLNRNVDGQDVDAFGVIRTATNVVRMSAEIRVGSTGTVHEAITPDLAINTWYGTVMQRVSTSDFRVYIYTGSLIWLIGDTTNIAGRAALTRQEVGASLTTNTRPSNVRVGPLKMWTAALSVSELQRELLFFTPQRTANLYGWWPGVLGLGDKDYAGSGRDWTPTGVTVEADPPISWAPPYTLVFPFFASVSVAPAAATARGDRVNPTVRQGSISLAPAARASRGQVLAPGVVLSSLAIGPTWAEALPSSQAPLVQLGSVSFLPGSASVRTDRVVPLVKLGPIVWSPLPASAVAARLDPAVRLGGLMITPAFSWVATSQVAPGIVLSSVSLTLLVAAARTAGVDPLVLLAGPFTPYPAEARTATVAPGIILSALVVTPLWASARCWSSWPSVAGDETFVLWQLDERPIEWTLEERDPLWQLAARLVIWPLAERPVMWELDERPVEWPIEERIQT